MSLDGALLRENELVLSGEAEAVDVVAVNDANFLGILEQVTTGDDGGFFTGQWLLSRLIGIVIGLGRIHLNRFLSPPRVRLPGFGIRSIF